MTQPSNDQEALDGLDATRIKIVFTNMTSDSLDTLPEIHDRQTFLVTTVCTGRGMELMKDGELRRTARMQVTALEAQGDPVKPSAAPANQLSLIDGEGQDD